LLAGDNGAGISRHSNYKRGFTMNQETKKQQPKQEQPKQTPQERKAALNKALENKIAQRFGSKMLDKIIII
jgi:FtsZ-interacting cell division protein YlmF